MRGRPTAGRGTAPARPRPGRGPVAGGPAAGFPQAGPSRRGALDREQVHGTCTNPQGGFVEVACAVTRGEQIIKGRTEGKTLPSVLDCRGFTRSRPAAPHGLRFRASRGGRAMARPYVPTAGTSRFGAGPRDCPFLECLPFLKVPRRARILRLAALAQDDNLGQRPACVFGLRPKGRTAVRPYRSSCGYVPVGGRPAGLPLPERLPVLEGLPTREDPSTRFARSG